MKPRTVSELFDYVENNPFLRATTGSGGTVRVRPDRRNRCLWEDGGYSHISLVSGDLFPVEVTFSDIGFSVATQVGQMINTHRYEYADSPES